MRKTICKPAASGPNLDPSITKSSSGRKRGPREITKTRAWDPNSFCDCVNYSSGKRNNAALRFPTMERRGSERSKRVRERERRGRRQRRREKKQCSVCGFIKEEGRPAGCMVKSINNNKSLRLCLLQFYDCKSGK